MTSPFFKPLLAGASFVVLAYSTPVFASQLVEQEAAASASSSVPAALREQEQPEAEMSAADQRVEEEMKPHRAEYERKLGEVDEKWRKYSDGDHATKMKKIASQKELHKDEHAAGKITLGALTTKLNELAAEETAVWKTFDEKYAEVQKEKNALLDALALRSTQIQQEMRQQEGE